MDPNLALYFNLGLNAFLTVCVIYSIIVLKTQLRAHKAITDNMKSFMDIFKVDEVKKYVELRHENIHLVFKNHVIKEGRKFVAGKEKYIRDILDKDIEKSVNDIENKYDELGNLAYDVILSYPLEERLKFIKEYLPLTGDDFIKELKADNEFPNQ